MRKMYRQGDVLIIEVTDLPKEKKTVERDSKGRLILAEGEATGHAHAIHASHAKMYAAGIGMFLMLKRAAELLHEEHGKIDLPPGNYQVIRQREYDPVKERLVRD